MDEEMKLMMGHLLGEIYELKNQISTLENRDLEHDPFLIQALKTGYEHIINQEFRLEDGFCLSQERYYELLKVLDDMEIANPSVFDNLTGFYDLPLELQNRFDRAEWLFSLKAMKKEHRFQNLISKIEGSQNSPTEFSSFD